MPWLALLAILAAIGAVLHRRRVREYIDSGSELDDDMIRRIEQTGSIELEDPLDYEEIAEEEERFLNETWDLPDEE